MPAPHARAFAEHEAEVEIGCVPLDEIAGPLMVKLGGARTNEPGQPRRPSCEPRSRVAANSLWKEGTAGEAPKDASDPAVADPLADAIRYLGYARDAASSMLRQDDLCRAAEALTRAGYPNLSALVTEAAERIGGDGQEVEQLLAELLALTGALDMQRENTKC